MRLLLLLSALFAALAGVTGTRVDAQPVQASVAVQAPGVAAETSAPRAIRWNGAAFGRVPAVRPPLTRLVEASGRPLYAERRRE